MTARIRADAESGLCGPNAALHAASQAQRVFRFAAPLPPRETHPNARVHWARKAKEAAAYRSCCRLCILDAAQHLPTRRPPQFARAVISLEYVFETARRRDADGLWSWAKQLIDATIDCGLAPDDAAEYLTLGTVSARKMTAGEQPEVRATVTEAR
jgi:crossover junction endodeoxyribonuclease RusA